MEQRTDILLIATGEYSDYENSAFKVLKPFTFGEMLEKYKKSKAGANGPQGFVAWLSRRGYIEDLPVHEIHVGSYGRTELDEETTAIQFRPA